MSTTVSYNHGLLTSFPVALITFHQYRVHFVGDRWRHSISRVGRPEKFLSYVCTSTSGWKRELILLLDRENKLKGTI